jgi:hypothetical protein
VYYPLGFPLRVETNSQQVLRAAALTWAGYGPMFDASPVRLRVRVEPGQTNFTPPAYRGQEHLMTILGGQGDFAVCDYTRRFAWCQVSESTAADPEAFGYFYLHAMACHILTQCHVTPLHAALIARSSSGIALCGASGAGKSSLAYFAARRGWTFLSDNESWLVRETAPPEIVGTPDRIRLRPSAAELFPELAGIEPSLRANGKMAVQLSATGIADLPTAQRCKVLRLVFLDRRPPAAPRLAPVPVAEALGLLLADVPMYEAHVRNAHRDSLCRLLATPALRMTYGTMEEALGLLDQLVAES